MGGVACTGSGAFWTGAFWKGSETAGGDTLPAAGVGAGVVGVGASGLGTEVGTTAGVGADTVRGTGLAGLLVMLLDPTAFLDCSAERAPQLLQNADDLVSNDTLFPEPDHREAGIKGEREKEEGAQVNFSGRPSQGGLWENQVQSTAFFHVEAGDQSMHEEAGSQHCCMMFEVLRA